MSVHQLDIRSNMTPRAIERFNSQYAPAEDGCWTWLGSTDKGYGLLGLKIGGTWRTVKAHRFSYELNVGPIPKGLQLDHLCRNRACVNPAHLEPVDNRTNSLRGQSPVALNARATHCPKGHEYTPDNTIVKATRCGLGRECRQCGRERQRRKAQVEGGLACPVCGGTYGSRKGLNAHMGKRHGMGTRHRILEAAADGLSPAAIAERVGCSLKHVMVELKTTETVR